jgi:CubicO group peptidase (beta-lactamase class C family)
MLKSILSIALLLLVAKTIPAQQLDPEKLDQAIIKADSLIENDPRVFFKNVESFIVYSQGKTRSEKYYRSFDRDSLRQVQSQTKSIVALLMGIAIDKGFVKSEDERVSHYYPEYFNNEDDLKSTVTIKNLLTMTAGFAWEEMIPFNDPGNDNRNMYFSGNWLKYALSRPMATRPFTEFNYNSGCPMIVAGIIEKATRMKLDEFAGKFLFEPLNINKYRWLKDSTGFCHAGGGLFMKPMDMMKIGVLVMNNGRWENHQVISADWIRKATDSYLTTSFDTSTYGYFWWIRQMKTPGGGTTKVVSAEGAGGQKMYIFPEYQLIIGFTENNFSTPQVSPLFIRESILPLLN